MLATIRKILGSIGCLALAALGVAIAIGALTPASLRGDGGSPRRRAIREALLWLVETIGPIPTGIVAVGIAALLLFLAWRPRESAEQASS